MNICKTCKTQRTLNRIPYYLGVKTVWECKCGKRLFRRGDFDWYNWSEEEREARGLE